MAKACVEDAQRIGERRPAVLDAVGIVLALSAVVLLGLSLRLIFGSASAVISEISGFYGLGSGAVALLTTGPVLCLGLFARLAPGVSRRWPVPAVITACLALITIGTALRGVPVWSALLVGTLLAGAGIAVANVLGPVLVRMLFPHRIGLVTGLLTALISVSAGVASGATVPIGTALPGNWRAGLAFWAVPAAAATAATLLVALRFRRHHRETAPLAEERPRVRLFRSPTAWAVTGFMGIQSLLAYSVIGWLPTIYRDRGWSAEHAGLLLTALSITSLVTALAIPIVAARRASQSVIALFVVSASVAGLVGVLSSGPDYAVLWAILLGLGQGGQLALALTLMNLRAASTAEAMSLSSMAQTVGYLFAATGPLLSGALRGITGNWQTSLLVLLALMVPLTWCGLIAGRPARESVPGT